MFSNVNRKYRTDSYRIFMVTCNICETFRITKFLSSHDHTRTDVELKNDKQNIIDKFVATPKNVNHHGKNFVRAQHQQKIRTQIAKVS